MYLGRIVEQGSAVDVIERPQHPYTQALVDAVPVPTRRRRRAPRAARAASCPTPTDVPSGCRFHPRCPRRFEPCDRVDPPLLAAGAPGQRAACLLHDPELAAQADAGEPMAERWRDLAGPVGRLEPGPRNAITDVPGVRVGHVAGRERRSAPASPWSRRRRLPAPAGDGGRQRRSASSPRSSRSTSAGAIETPVYLCGSHAVGTVFQAAVARLRARPRQHRAAGRRRVRRRRHGRLARRSSTGDVDAALAALGDEVAEGTRRRRHRHDAASTSPAGSAPRRGAVGEHHVGVLLLCNFGDREYLDLLGARLDPPRPPGRRRHGSCIAVCATDAPLSTAAAAPPRAAAAARARPGRLVRRRGLGGDRRSRSRPTARPRTSPTSELDPLLRRRLRGRARGGLQLPRRGAPATLLDGTMQDAFPVDLVRELARRRERAARRGGRARPRADPNRHLEPARQREPRGAPTRRLPGRGRGRVAS